MLAFALRLEAPPLDAGDTGLAYSMAACRCRFLLTRTHRSVMPGGCPAKSLPVSALELAGNRLRQCPCQDRQAGMLPGQHGGSGGGAVVRVPSDPGIVEGKQSAGPGARRRRGGVRRQIIGRDPY